MEKESILKKLLTGKNKDYTYAIAFFFIFSFFVFYVIRPNVLSVFEANQTIDRLNQINKTYGDQINKIIEVQTIMEQNRDDLDYLAQAISNKPDINKVLSDIDISSSGSKLNPEEIAISDINLKGKSTTTVLKSFEVNMTINGSFQDMIAFTKKIYDQRRLKIMKDLVFSQDQQASGSGNLGIKLDLEGYYL